MNTARYDADIPMITNYQPEGTSVMLLDQELARIRLHEIRLVAEEQRLARRLSATARWRKVAGWAAGKGAQPQCKGVAPLGGPYAGLVGQETVLPSEGDVIAPVPHKQNLELPAGQEVALMTLTTCTPKFSASHRLILHAVLTNQYAKDPKQPDKVPPELKETD